MSVPLTLEPAWSGTPWEKRIEQPLLAACKLWVSVRQPGFLQMSLASAHCPVARGAKWAPHSRGWEDPGADREPALSTVAVLVSLPAPVPLSWPRLRDREGSRHSKYLLSRGARHSARLNIFRSAS